MRVEGERTLTFYGASGVLEPPIFAIFLEKNVQILETNAQIF